MRRVLDLAVCALVTACLHVPPAIDEHSVHTPPPGRAPPPSAAAEAKAPPSATPAAPLPAVVTRPARTCPVATGRRTFCEGRKVCSRDLDGCEKCVCNTELDSGRAGFEQANPWDMRQR